VILAAAVVLVTILCGLGLRRLDALNAQSADALASRVKLLHGSRSWRERADRRGAARLGRL